MIKECKVGAEPVKQRCLDNNKISPTSKKQTHVEEDNKIDLMEHTKSMAKLKTFTFDNLTAIKLFL